MEGEHRRILTETEQLRSQGATVETVDLPSVEKEELLGETPGSPLHAMFQFFRESGISEKEIEQYRAAVRAFHERPTNVVRRASLDFVPQDYYFAPRIDLPNKALLPRVFPRSTEDVFSLFKTKDFQPKLDHDGVRREFPIGEKDVENAFLALTLQNPVQESGSDVVATPEERFLVRINRVMYALHEPLHIRQGLAVGDRVNIARQRLHIGVEMNQEKERLFVDVAKRDQNVKLFPPSIFGKTVFPWPKQEQGDDSSEESEEWTQALIEQNEATMDALSEFALKKSLREKPPFLLWVHNTLCLAVEMFRTIEVRARDLNRNQDEDAEKFIDLKNALGQVEAIFDSIQQVYFSAFDGSEDAGAYFQDDNLPTTLGKKLSGAVAKPSQPFNRFSVLNLKLDVQRKLSFGSYREHTYARSNEVHRVPIKSPEYYHAYPVTSGAQSLLVELFDKAHQMGKTGPEIQTLFTRITKTFDESPTEQLSAVLEEIQDVWGLDWKSEDVGELVGMEQIVAIRFNDRYPLGLATRKMLMEHFFKTAPEEVAPLIRGLFFQSPFSFENDNLARLVGFMALESDAKEYTPFENILAEHAVGVFDLDIPRFSTDELETLWGYYEKVSSGNSISSSEQEEMVRWMAEMRRKQLVTSTSES